MADQPSPPGVIMVDRIACTGRGLCAILLPERITLDEWGYPIVDPTPVGAEEARDALRVCPHRALRLATPAGLSRGGSGTSRTPGRAPG